MFKIWKKIFKTGIITRKNPFKRPPKKHRGKIFADDEKCDGSNTCVHICPAEAISLTDHNEKAELTFDYSKCMLCGLCVEYCPSDALTQTNEPVPSTRNKEQLKETFYIKKTATTRERDV